MTERIPVTEIRIQRAEGNLETDSFDPVTVATWEEANATLRAWARTAPGPRQGYHKCDFAVTWADGETYHGRYDLEGRETETADIGAHIASLAAFMGGKWRSWASPAEYAGVLAQHEKDEPGVTATWAAFLDRYDLGGAAPPRNEEAPQPDPEPAPPASRQVIPGQLFALGQVGATPGAVGLGVDLAAYVRRHACGDFGTAGQYADIDLTAREQRLGALATSDDGKLNLDAIRNGGRVLSVYDVPGGPLWVMTDGLDAGGQDSGETYTMAMLADEY